MAELAMRQTRTPETPGYLEYEARTIVRDLIRVKGFEGARELLAQYILEEASR